jgi:glycosyltransferase involved in cell wall biosynthesis
MKVFYLSKACAVPAYQHKLTALAAHADVQALVPARWGAARTTVNGSAAARVEAARALLHGHNHLHIYPGLARSVRAARPDIVHADEEPYSAVTYQVARVCARLRVPFVFFAWQNLEKRVPWPFGALRAHVFRHAAHAIAGTQRAGAVLHSAGWRGATSIIPQFGVDTTVFRPDAEARSRVRASIGVPAGAFVAGFAGRLVAEKGVDLLLDAAAAAGVHVLLMGGGTARPGLERDAAARGSAGRVHFAGHIPSLEVASWLNALDVLVLPSRTTRRWSEQFGRVLVEAMACGVPVAGAATGEIPHVIGDAGLTFAEGDGAGLAALLRELSTAPALGARLRAAGRQRVAALFTQERIARDTAAVYETVLARRPAHAS